MQKFFKDVSIYFTAGAVGSIVKMLFVSFVLSAFYSQFGIKSLFVGFISYKVLVFDALWGLLFFIPTKSNSMMKILIVAIIYALYMLLYFVPLHTKYGIFAINAGISTILSVFVVSIIWAMASWFYTCLNK